MSKNTGNTTLKRRRRARDPMHEFDRLPRELRQWMSTAMLPWGAGSARKAYQRAVTRTGDPMLALKELDAIQDRLIRKDAGQVWGAQHPAAHITR